MVVGACLLTPDSIRFAASTLEPDDFKSPKLAGVFRSIVHLVKSGDPVEPFTVFTRAQELGVRGLEVVELHKWLAGVGSAESISYYADQVREAAARRRLYTIATTLLRDAQDETLHPTEASNRVAEAIK